MPVSMKGSPVRGSPPQPPQQGDMLMAAKAKNQQQRRPIDALSAPGQVAPGGKWDHLASADPMDLDMRDNATISAHRTAARTGTTFDMADLITDGHATKLTNTKLPADHPAMQVIALNEFMLPGDVLGHSPRHPPVTDPIDQRMAHIIRERSLDLVNLMDDFLKRPAYSLMPTRNRAFIDVPTFRRALCYAFGDQWTRLAMTSPEFKQLVDQYVRRDAGHGSQGGDVQGFGQPEPLILWQEFARAIMILSDGDKYTIKLRGAMNAETLAMYEKSLADAKNAEDEYAKHSGLDIGKAGSGHLSSNKAEAMASMQEKQMEKQRADARPIGKRGARVGEVNAAKKLICDRLIEKNATVRKALKDLDESGDGILSREEIKKFLREQNMMKYFDFYTGQTRGALEPKVVDTLLDMVDANEDGQINYTEFSDVVMEAAN